MNVRNFLSARQNDLKSNYEEASDLDLIEDSSEKVHASANKPIFDVGSVYQTIYQSKKPFISDLNNHIYVVNINNLSCLGSGQFKSVFGTTFSFNEKDKSIAIAVQKTILQGKDQAAFEYELDKTIELSSKEISGLLPLYEVLKNKITSEEMLISKLCSGDLAKMFAKEPKFNVGVIKLAWDAVSAIHSAGYVHRDIKATNFLFYESKKGKVKVYLSDFGLTTKSNSAVKDLKTNFSIEDPYSYKKRKERSDLAADPKSDTWAFGMMICNLLRSSHQELAFDGDDRVEIEHVFDNWTVNGAKIDREKSEEKVAAFIEKTPFDNCLELKELVKKMMAYDPKDRPSDDEIAVALKSKSPLAMTV